LALLVLALVPSRPSLSAKLDELLAPARPAPGSTAPAPTKFLDAMGAGLWALVDADGERFPALAKDLAVMDQTTAGFARQIITTAALFPVFAVAVFVALAVTGVHFQAGLVAWLVVLAAAAGAAAPRPSIRVDANKRRAEMREVVAVICDLAAVVVAAGEDVDGALVGAAGAGEGWAFDAIRRALPTVTRQGAWVAMAGLGERLGVDELIVLAQNMGLAEQKGAKVREALNAQAKTLREELASEVEAQAGSVTERMSFPMVMLLVGFLLVIGYPAIARL
jgi:Flp pilus assembly protein TadB